MARIGELLTTLFRRRTPDGDPLPDGVLLERFARTRDPAAFIGLTRSLAVTNLADPSTPRIFQVIFGTHPTTLQRIGAGLAWAREH